jgi:FkbM family methyltransferase
VTRKDKTFLELVGNLALYEAGGLQFYLRENSSDEGVADDNISRRVILKHLTVTPGSKWIDCGGYIGTFSMVLKELGAEVFAVEADPSHVSLYNINMTLNNWEPHVICAAVVADYSARTQMLSINDGGKHMNVAANTLIADRWKTERRKLPVACIRFEELVCCAKEVLGQEGSWNLKFDIEGSEIPLLETKDFSMFDNIYIEYHFDADKSIARAERVIKRLKSQGFIVYQNHKLPADKENWEWFPAMLVLWCTKGSNNG